MAMVVGLLALGGCALPREIDPFVIYGEVTGEIDAGRERPPGLDRPFPRLGAVPPRPERPGLRFRTEVTDALAADRAASREPLAPRRHSAAAAEAEAPGIPPLPASPPPPPRLAAAPSVPWQPRQGETVETPSQPAPELGAVPSLPTPDLLAAPPDPPSVRPSVR
jgi:hypothetical protein